MAYVIADACIDVKDRTCLAACPVDCIYEGGRSLYIHPDECINCALCVSVCPVEAIYADDELPPGQAQFAAINAEFFGPDITGWGKPGGAAPRFTTDKDHPTVAGWPRK
jgi:ferredoxin